MTPSRRPFPGLLWGVAALAAASCTGLATSSDGTAVSEETGIASYYAHEFHGRTTANGETYDENELTAAHRTLPFGAHVRVTNLANERSVVVRINDRGPFVQSRIIDVSYAAARRLGFINEGLATVKLEVLDGETP